jgi:hypothetical protein
MVLLFFLLLERGLALLVWYDERRRRRAKAKGRPVPDSWFAFRRVPLEWLESELRSRGRSLSPSLREYTASRARVN